MTSVDSQLLGGSSPENSGEQNLALAVGQSPVMFYTASAHGDFSLTYISENVESQTGHTAANMLSAGSYRDQHIHPDDLPAYRLACKNLQPGGTASCQYRLRLKGGGERWYRDELSRPADDASVLTGCMIDISSHMVETEADQDRLRIYRDAVESIDGGFCVTDSNDTIIACNTILAMSTDFGPERFIGQPRRRLVEDILAKIEIFDGEPVEQTAAWADKISERIRLPTGGGLELKMAAGYWVRVTFAPTIEGGQIILITNIHAQKKLEREMRESAERFRLLVESHPLPVMLVDVKNGSILYESPAASALLGHEWGPDADFKVQDMYADPAERQRVVAELRRDGELRNRRIKQKRDDGSIYWVAVTSNLVVYEGREIHIASIVDITEERARETALARAHETLEDAIESLSEGFALYDHEDRLVAFNSRYLEYNKPCADLIKPGLLWEDLIRIGASRESYFESAAEMESFIRDHGSDRRQGNARTGYEYSQSDGRRFQCAWRPTRQGGTVVTVADVSESKEMERVLRESAEHFRMLVESHPLPVILVDMESGRVLYESPAASAMFGREWSPEFDFKVQELYADPADRADFIDELRRTGELRNRPLRYKRHDGSFYWISLTSRMIMYEGREAHITSIVDLTEQQERESALRLANETLEDAIESLSEGFALFDHDDRLVTFNSRFTS
ncbi:MAG: PAS domain S-box protein [Alphaproteobacteria bacterium]|nr:PAS domain S-box protein [Alphaproteobacteria bacterium]MDP6832946.1 PAS domain S-box protein [Alphaproteobacteria bacterium]